MPDISTIRVILPREQIIRLEDVTLSGGGGGGNNFTLNGSTNSVSLVAGAGISFASNLSTITISNKSAFTFLTGSMSGNTLGAASTTIEIRNSFALSGAGIVSVGAEGGNGTITVSATTANVVSAIGTAGALSTGSIVLVAGNNITINTGASSITIVGPSPGVGAATQSFSGGGTSITGTAISVALFGGNNVSLASASGAGSLSLTVNASSNALNNVSLLNASSGALSVSAGAGIGIGQANSTITVSASVQTASVSMTALGNTTVSSSGTHTNLINISGAGAISVGVGAQSITISAPIPVNFSTVSLSASGNTTGATSSGTFNNVLAFSGMGAISIGAGNGTISISGPSGGAAGTQSFSGGGTSVTGTGISVALFGGNNISLASASGAGSLSLTFNASSNALNNVSLLNASSGALSVSAGAGIGIGQANSTITISASVQTASVSLTALGNTTSSSSGTYSGLLNVSGAGGVSVGAGAQSLTISGPVQSTLVAGANISLTSGAGSITIIGVPNALSLTQIQPLAEVAGTAVSKAGTVTGTAGVGSSLFLQRINIPGKMSLTEIDVAMSIGFPATSQGAGTMSRSMVVYSFGNSTSLASVMSASGTSAWQTGTSTSGAVVSLTQFQGGWSSPLIQPMTFASTSLSAGDYVVGQLFNFAQGSSTWTLAFYGGQAYSSAGALSSAGLLAGSAFTGTTNITVNSESLAAGSGITAITQNATNNISWFVSRATSAVTSVASATSSFTFLEAPFVGSIGTVAGSVITGTTVQTALSNSGLSAFSFLSATTSLSAGVLTLPNFGFIGTGSTTSGFPTAFMAGIMSTGAVPTAITLTSTAVTYSGTIAWQQPWFGLAGA